MIESVTEWIKGDSWNMVPGLRDGLLMLTICILIVTPVVWYVTGPYYQGISEMYSSMTCAELKEMMINNSGTGPIFRGHYAERCI